MVIARAMAMARDCGIVGRAGTVGSWAGLRVRIRVRIVEVIMRSHAGLFIRH